MVGRTYPVGYWKDDTKGTVNVHTKGGGMSHEGNDELRERFAEDVQEMSHREKVMTLLGFFYDSGMWITVDGHPVRPIQPTIYHRSRAWTEDLNALLIEVMYRLHLHDGDAGEWTVQTVTAKEKLEYLQSANE